MDFLEIFAGEGRLTIAVKQAGWSVAEPVDKKQTSYGRWWDLSRPEDQQILARYIVEADPLLIHLGTPCTHVCMIGSNEAIPQEHLDLYEFSLKVVRHQQARGRFVSVENPKGSYLFACKVGRPSWTAHCGESLRLQLVSSG